jgi:hypothetical protein
VWRNGDALLNMPLMQLKFMPDENILRAGLIGKQRVARIKSGHVAEYLYMQ